MEIFDSYRNYKSHEKEYDIWKKKADADNQKRLNYLKKNPVSEAERKMAIQRGERVLEAIDTMDELSQSNAEDTEAIMQTAISGITSVISQVAAAATVLAIFGIPFLRNYLMKNQNSPGKVTLLLSLPTMIVSALAYIPLAAADAKLEMKASSQGRFEAMKKDLSQVQQFSILSSEQQEEQKKLSKDVVLDKKEERKKTFNLNIIDSINTVKNLVTKGKEHEKDKKAFEEELAALSPKDGAVIDKKQMEEAKRNQQLLFKTVEKIDIASQDYAENVEMTTKISTGLIAMLLAGSSFSAEKIMRKMAPKMSENKRSLIIMAGALLPLALWNIFTAKIDKYASRIGRYKAIKDLKQNPDNFVYVSDEAIKNEPDVIQKDKPKGIFQSVKNFFSFAKQMFKDNKEYNEYLKKEAIESRKMNKALNKIKLTKEQEVQAKELQLSTFKTFNRVDANSQKFSENTEALGEIAGRFIGIGSSLILMLLMMKDMDKVVKNNKNKNFMMSKALLQNLLIAFLPACLLEIFITKEQKKASRVANMMAIKDLEDYRNFVYRSNENKDASKTGNVSVINSVVKAENAKRA